MDLCQNQLKRGGACALAKAVANKPALALLHLDENEISEAGIGALKVRHECALLLHQSKLGQVSVEVRPPHSSCECAHRPPGTWQGGAHTCKRETGDRCCTQRWTHGE